MKTASLIYAYSGEEDIGDESEKWIIIATDNEKYEDIVKTVKSGWPDITETPVDTDDHIYAIHPEYEIITAYEVADKVLVKIAEKYELSIEIVEV
jgi:hypothetical protein